MQLSLEQTRLLRFATAQYEDLGLKPAAAYTYCQLCNWRAADITEYTGLSLCTGCKHDTLPDPKVPMLLARFQAGNWLQSVSERHLRPVLARYVSIDWLERLDVVRYFAEDMVSVNQEPSSFEIERLYITPRDAALPWLMQYSHLQWVWALHGNYAYMHNSYAHVYQPGVSRAKICPADTLVNHVRWWLAQGLAPAETRMPSPVHMPQHLAEINEWVEQ